MWRPLQSIASPQTPAQSRQARDSAARNADSRARFAVLIDDNPALEVDRRSPPCLFLRGLASAPLSACGSALRFARHLARTLRCKQPSSPTAGREVRRRRAPAISSRAIDGRYRQVTPQTGALRLFAHPAGQIIADCIVAKAPPARAAAFSRLPAVWRKPGRRLNSTSCAPRS